MPNARYLSQVPGPLRRTAAMHDVLRQRLMRKIESLPDEQIYQVLDYIEFLESKYSGAAPVEASGLQKFAEGLEDKLRTAGGEPEHDPGGVPAHLGGRPGAVGGIVRRAADPRRPQSGARAHGSEDVPDDGAHRGGSEEAARGSRIRGRRLGTARRGERIAGR